MNFILLDADEVASGLLAINDPRSLHIQQVLKGRPGMRLRAGVLGGDRGLIELHDLEPAGWRFSFQFSSTAPPLKPLTVLLALCRPPVLRRLLRDLSSIGCQRVLLFTAQLSEGSYRQSHIWQQIPDLLRNGAQQGGQTHLPQWQYLPNLASALALVEAGGLWCDCLTAPPLLLSPLVWPASVALGPERGWSESERALALQAKWKAVSLGQALLRCELAAQLAVGLLCQRWEFEVH